MTSAADVIEVATRDIGYVEGRNNDSKFGRWYGMNNAPYCAMAVSYWFYLAGRPLDITTPKGFAYCPYGVKWFKDHDAWFQTPVVGDVVFFDWDRDGIADHTGIVTAIHSGSITTIEANTSPDSYGSQSNGGGVYVRTRPMSVVMGFGRPTYGASNPRPTVTAPAWPGRYFSLSSPMMFGTDITLWQRQMKNRGWSIAVDGFYGPESEKVCRQFQNEKRLTVDGVVGPVTWRATWEAPVTP